MTAPHLPRTRASASATDIERLELHSEPDLNGGCRLWTAATSSTGYGATSKKTANGTVMAKAHRLAYELAYGPIPDNQLVCHSCDVRLCIEPTHLFLGTHGDNSADMVRKGRSCAGDRHYAAKITMNQAEEIRTICSARTITQRAIAAHYGISRQAVGLIVNGKTWISRKSAAEGQLPYQPR